MTEVLRIKNMVCPRCIMAVENVLKELDVAFHSIELGEVCLKQSLSEELSAQLSDRFEQIGFEIIVDKREMLVERVKAIILDLINTKDDQLKVNLSDYLHDQLGLDYNYISKQFSDLEHQTIERFLLSNKIERVKQLISYNELSLTEIADKLHYSSVAHLSAQFKKYTGQTPTQYKMKLISHRK